MVLMTWHDAGQCPREGRERGEGGYGHARIPILLHAFAFLQLHCVFPVTDHHRTCTRVFVHVCVSVCVCVCLFGCVCVCV
jgi:hypothetical protein